MPASWKIRSGPWGSTATPRHPSAPGRTARSTQSGRRAPPRAPAASRREGIAGHLDRHPGGHPGGHLLNRGNDNRIGLGRTPGELREHDPQRGHSTAASGDGAAHFGTRSRLLHDRRARHRLQRACQVQEQPLPDFDVAALGADRLSDHPLRDGLEVLVQDVLQLLELRQSVASTYDLTALTITVVRRCRGTGRAATRGAGRCDEQRPRPPVGKRNRNSSAGSVSSSAFRRARIGSTHPARRAAAFRAGPCEQRLDLPELGDSCCSSSNTPASVNAFMNREARERSGARSAAARAARSLRTGRAWRVARAMPRWPA